MSTKVNTMCQTNGSCPYKIYLANQVVGGGGGKETVAKPFRLWSQNSWEHRGKDPGLKSRSTSSPKIEYLEVSD